MSARTVQNGRGVVSLAPYVRAFGARGGKGSALGLSYLQLSNASPQGQGSHPREPPGAGLAFRAPGGSAVVQNNHPRTSKHV
jgi:hypothetical protein